MPCLRALGALEFAEELPTQRGHLKGVWKYGQFSLDLEGAIDFQAERDRLEKELARIKTDIQKILKKLNSHEFMNRAPEDVVIENRNRHAELLERFARVEANLKQLLAE